VTASGEVRVRLRGGSHGRRQPWKWAEVRSWGEANRSQLEAWIAARPILPYDAEIARTWARMSAGAQLRGRPRPQNDTWIAACCVRHGVPLVTINKRDFAPFVERDGLVLLAEAD
jgi:toxin FitB